MLADNCIVLMWMDTYCSTGILDTYNFFVSFTGIGSGVPSVARMVAIRHYFVKKFNMAVSWSFTLGTTGLFVLPILVEYLNIRFGWRGAVLIYGAMNLHICAAGALILTPSGSHDKSQEKPVQVTECKAEEYNNEKKASKKSNAAKLVNSFGLSVLTQRRVLVIYLMAMGFHELVLSGWALFLVSYAVSHGFTAETASLFSGIGGIGAVVGRLVLGPITNNGRVSGLNLFGLLAAGGTISIGCYPLCTTYWSLVVVSFTSGMCLGSASPVYMILLKEMFPNGSTDFASAVGLHYMFRGFGNLIGGPLTGMY